MPHPKDVHILSTRICKYVFLHDKRNFANVIKNLKMGRFSGLYFGECNVIVRVLLSERWR